MSFKWWPFTRTHVWSRSRKFASTLPTVSSSISSIRSRIAVFNSSSVRGLPSYTRDFKYPQRQKSHMERSGDRGGHRTSPKWETTRLGNAARTTFMEALAVWAVAPSCWNHTSLLLIPRLQFWFEKVFKHVYVASWINGYCGSIFFEEKWPENPALANTTPHRYFWTV